MPLYTIRLIGPEEQAVPLSGTLLASFFRSLDKSTKGAVRLRLDGRSFAGGTQPSWLARASFYRLVDVDTQNSTFKLSAPSLQETVAATTPQYQLIAEDDSHKTGLTLFGEGLRDALGEIVQADTYDGPLLKAFQSFANVFNEGVVGLEMTNSSLASPRIDLVPESLKRLTSLRPKHYHPRYVKVAGQLNMIRFSDRAFSLDLASGTTVRGIFNLDAPRPLDEYFGKQVVVSGKAVFRASGSLFRIDADQVDPANEADKSLWGAMPRPEEGRIGKKDFFETQGRRSGVAEAFGKWPRELSDEDANEVVELLSSAR